MRRRLAALTAGLVLLCGCWSYHEISDGDFVAGIAVDREGKTWVLTLELADFSGTLSPATVTAKAETLSGAADAARRSRRLYWDHAAVVIVGEAPAREGLGEIVSLLGHTVETALELHLLVARGEAGKLLELSLPGQPILSYGLKAMLENPRTSGATVPGRLYDTLSDEPSLAAVVEADGDAPVLRGSAVLRQGQVTDYLDGEETALVRLLRGELSHWLMGEPDSMPGTAVELLDVRCVPTEMGLAVHTGIGVVMGGTAKKGLSELEEAAAGTLEDRLNALARRLSARNPDLCPAGPYRVTARVLRDSVGPWSLEMGERDGISGR